MYLSKRQTHFTKVLEHCMLTTKSNSYPKTWNFVHSILVPNNKTKHGRREKKKKKTNMKWSRKADNREVLESKPEGKCVLHKAQLYGLFLHKGYCICKCWLPCQEVQVTNENCFGNRWHPKQSILSTVTSPASQDGAMSEFTAWFNNKKQTSRHKKKKMAFKHDVPEMDSPGGGKQMS